MNRPRFYAGFATVLALLSAAALADDIFLKDGTVLEGAVIPCILSPK
jgi:hypothetical protein